MRLRSEACTIGEVAGAAGVARRAQVAGIHEAHELGRLAVEQRVASLGLALEGQFQARG